MRRVTQAIKDRLKSPSVWAAGIFLLSLGFYALYFNRGMLLADEGTLIHASQRIAEGQVPYRDFYHFYAPGRFYLLAALFKVFGQSFLLSRIMWVIVRAAITTMVFLAAKRFMPTRFAIWPVIVVLLVPGPWFKSFYAFSGLLTLIAILGYIDRRTLGRLAIAACCVGIALLLRQDVGMEAAVALVVAVVLSAFSEPHNGGTHPALRAPLRGGEYRGSDEVDLQSPPWEGCPKGGVGSACIEHALPESHGSTKCGTLRPWVRMFGHLGFAVAVLAVTLAPVLLYFHSNDALSPMYKQMFLMAPSYTLAKIGATVQKLRHATSFPFETAILLLVPLMVVLGSIAALVRAIRAGLSNDNICALILFGMAGMTLIPAYIPMAPIRLWQCSILALIAIAYLFYLLHGWVSRGSLRFVKPLPCILLALFSMAYLLHGLFYSESKLSKTNYAGTITRAMRSREPFLFRGEQVYLTPKKGRQLKALTRYIRKNTDEGEPIIAFPNQALLYYLCNRPNHTRFVATFTLNYPEDIQDKEIWREWVSEARRVSPRYIIVHQSFMIGATKHDFRRLAKKFYTEDTRFGELIVMKQGTRE